MNRLFCQTHTVRYDECDGNGLLTPTSFVRYMQDIAARDTEDAQLDGDGFWVVRRTAISFLAPVVVHTPLVLRTYGIGFTRVTAQRGYEACLAGDGYDEAVACKDESQYDELQASPEQRLLL